MRGDWQDGGRDERGRIILRFVPDPEPPEPEPELRELRCALCGHPFISRWQAVLCIGCLDLGRSAPGDYTRIERLRPTGMADGRYLREAAVAHWLLVKEIRRCERLKDRSSPRRSPRSTSPASRSGSSGT